MTTGLSIRLAMKRFLDIVMSAIGLVLVAPLLGVAAGCSLLIDGWPAFMAVRRVGHRGRIFRMWKLRTMVRDAEAQRIALERQHGCSAWQLLHDPRVTTTGRFLRRWSIDELPQLWNVLIGDMSLVGYRPPSPHELKFMNYVHPDTVRFLPGMTGPVQVQGRSGLTVEEQAGITLAYLGAWSLLHDLQILIRTPAAVLRHPHHLPRRGRSMTWLMSCLLIIGLVLTVIVQFIVLLPGLLGLLLLFLFWRLGDRAVTWPRGSGRWR